MLSVIEHPFTSLDMPFFWGALKSLYPEKLRLLPTNGIVLNLPMEKLGNCHNVISELPAGSSGAPVGHGNGNNVTVRLSQSMARP
jgi:hypothetical protein